MAHNFIEQLDLIADPTGNTALAGTTFISADGNDADAGTDPNLPKQNLNAATVPTLTIVIGADQVYPQFPTGNKIYIGDGKAILDGENTRGIYLSTTQANIFFNCHVLNFLYSRGTSASNFLNMDTAATIQGSIFENNSNFRIRGTQLNYIDGIKRCFFKNQSGFFFALGGVAIVPITDSIFYNQGVKQTIELDNTGVGQENEWSSNCYINVEIVTNQSQIELFTSSYFDPSVSFIIDGTPYANITALQIAIPTACPGAVTGSADFAGSLNQNEYQVVVPSSLLLGNGKNGVNIGNVNQGLVFNESNVQSSTNITFAAGVITLTNPLVDGQIVWEAQFNRVVVNPILELNGISDYVNNIVKTIQVPDPTKPSKLTCEIETQDKDEPYRPIKVYRFGYKIGEDSFNVSSGQDDYHEFGVQRLRVIGVRVTFTIQA